MWFWLAVWTRLSWFCFFSVLTLSLPSSLLCCPHSFPFLSFTFSAYSLVSSLSPLIFPLFLCPVSSPHLTLSSLHLRPWPLNLHQMWGLGPLRLPNWQLFCKNRLQKIGVSLIPPHPHPPPKKAWHWLLELISMGGQLGPVMENRPCAVLCQAYKRAKVKVKN